MRKRYRMVRPYQFINKEEGEKTARKLASDDRYGRAYTVRKVRTKNRGSGGWDYHWRLFKEAP